MYSMLILFVSSFRIAFATILAATIAICMIYYQDYSSSSTKHNNKTRGRSWNRPTISGTPLGMDLDEVGRNRTQSGTPHGMSHSES